MMAANAANDGSGRCQPKFVSDDEYRRMVIRNHPMSLNKQKKHCNCKPCVCQQTGNIAFALC
jgi:hypothetical protein